MRRAEPVSAVFLELTLRRNPDLVRWAVAAHQSLQIPANTYVVDLDRFRANAALLAHASAASGVQLYFMLKQLGDLPLLAQTAQEAGLPAAVAVSGEAALSLAEAGIRLGHVGHLAQVPRALISRLLAYRPEVITVFDPDYVRNMTIDVAAPAPDGARQAGPVPTPSPSRDR